MKLRKLHIDDYKMFKDFDISFVDENDEALPIVVLAGVNGSGKTTILGVINDINMVNDDKSYIEYEKLNEEQSRYARNYIYNIYKTNSLDVISPFYNRTEEEKIIIEKLNKNVISFLSGIDDIKKVADEFVKTFYHFLKNKDYRPSEVTEHFHDYMKDIFSDLDIGFKYSHLDRDDNVWFSSSKNKGYYYTSKKNNTQKENLFKIDELSTGEKTLLSKVMYLYFLDYKDKVILIDEPELSLHPSWQNKVLKIYENFARKNNCQIIIATHSPHIIASAKNEYLRILRKKEDGNIEVISDLKAHGRDINSILFDVMGEVAYRPKEFDDKIDRLHIAIDDRKIEEALKRLEELKKDYGENDEVVMEAQMLIDMFSRDEE